MHSNCQLEKLKSSLPLNMKHVIISAFSCDPTKGSEPGNGWMWASGIASRGYFVHLLTTSRAKENIDHQIEVSGLSSSIKVHYIDHSGFWRWAYFKNFILMYAAYWLWQKKILKYVINNLMQYEIAFIHHVTWGSLKMGSSLYKTNIPMLFGPIGGGQKTPLIFKDYLGKDYWKEKLRNKLGPVILGLNPLSKNTLSNSKVLVTNKDTFELAKKYCTSTPDIIFDCAIKEATAEKKWQETTILNLLWVGRVYGFKGLRLIIAALSKLPSEQLIKIELTIVGDGPDLLNIQKAVKGNHLQDVVVFTGMIPYNQVADYYIKSDVFIYTSLRDSFPSQLLEAQLFSLPVITLDLHGQALMVNQDTGIKCSIDDPEQTVQEIVSAIQFFLEHSNEIIRLGKNAHKFAILQTWDKKIDQIVSKYYPEK